MTPLELLCRSFLWWKLIVCVWRQFPILLAESCSHQLSGQFGKNCESNLWAGSPSASLGLPLAAEWPCVCCHCIAYPVPSWLLVWSWPGMIYRKDPWNRLTLVPFYWVIPWLHSTLPLLWIAVLGQTDLLLPNLVLEDPSLCFPCRNPHHRINISPCHVTIMIHAKGR